MKTATATTTNQAHIAPKVINLGKVTKSQVSKLKKGYGKLMEEVHQIAAHEVAQLPDPGEGKTYRPVVIVHRRKDEPTGLLANMPGKKKLRKKVLKTLGL
jgi:hypothetical protein